MEEQTTQQEAFVSEYDALFEELQKAGFSDWAYDPETPVVVSGRLFTIFTNTVGILTQYTASLKEQVDKKALAEEKFYGAMSSSLSDVLDKLSGVTVELMKQHLTNCKNGVAITKEAMDKLDAKQKIQVTKND